MKDAPGKTALVTGASTGLGRELAELFARDGHHLVITARNESLLQDLARRLRDQYRVNVDVIVQNLAESGAAQRIFDSLQTRQIDYLVNNAGFGTHGLFAELDPPTELAMLQVNVVAPTHLTRLFLPGMLQRGSGRILNLASVASYLPGPLMAVYFASKAYVLSFSEALASEVAGSGVTVTAMCPGPTETEFQRRAGIQKSNLFMNAMQSATCAGIGYRAMMKGKTVIVTGVANKFSVLGMRLVSRRRTAAMAKKLNSNR